VKTNFEALNLAVVTDEFDADTFDENVDTEHSVEEDDEAANNESNEENVQPSIDTAPDGRSVDTVNEGNEANMPSLAATACDVLTSSCID
jgi:hypothetical protein